MFPFLILLLEVFQVVIAVVASIIFFVLAGLTLASSAVALTVTTPLFIIFSPILVPATIATAVLTTWFTAGGTLGATAIALVRRRMGLKPKNNIPPTGAPPTVFVGSSPAQSMFMPKISYEGTFKGSLGGSASAPTMQNFSYGGTWTATFGGRSFSGSFGDRSAGGSTPEAAGGSTPATAAAPAAAATPAAAAAPPG